MIDLFVVVVYKINSNFPKKRKLRENARKWSSSLHFDFFFLFHFVFNTLQVPTNKGYIFAFFCLHFMFLSWFISNWKCWTKLDILFPVSWQPKKPRICPFIHDAVRIQIWSPRHCAIVSTRILVQPSVKSGSQKSKIMPQCQIWILTQLLGCYTRPDDGK